MEELNQVPMNPGTVINIPPPDDEFDNDNISVNSPADARHITTEQSQEQRLITVPASVLKDMQDQIASLTKAVGPGNGVQFEEPEANTVIVYTYNGNYVVGVGKSFEEKLADDTRRLMMEIYVRDEEKPQGIATYTFDINEFRRASIEGVEKHVCPIVDIIRRANNKVVGKTTLKELKYEDFRTEDTGIVVPMTIHASTFIYRVKMTDGKIVEIPEGAVNLSNE